MSQEKVYPVPATFAANAHINSDRYQEMYQRSVDNPEAFWAEQAERFVSWYKPWDKVLDWDFHQGTITAEEMLDRVQAEWDEIEVPEALVQLADAQGLMEK